MPNWKEVKWSDLRRNEFENQLKFILKTKISPSATLMHKNLKIHRHDASYMSNVRDCRDKIVLSVHLDNWFVVAKWMDYETPNLDGLLYLIERLFTSDAPSSVTDCDGTLSAEEHKALEIIDA
jgi:hypothetical protein